MMAVKVPGVKYCGTSAKVMVTVMKLAAPDVYSSAAT
jgi:hypothetical protein